MEAKDYPAEYLKFIELFNRGDFFEAHEVLEDLWRIDKTENREFYQGLIQIAAVFVHILKNTPEGAKRLFKTASAYLEKYPSEYMGLELDKLLRQTEDSLLRNTPFPQIILGY